MNQLMNQSTIYLRHEARRQRTLALKDDPRPAAIRVLSGLPGFRVIIPPYQPPTTAVTSPPYSSPLTNAVQQAPVFSEETYFSTNDSFGTDAGTSESSSSSWW